MLRSLVWLPSSTHAAQRFLPLLIDLAGWPGNKPGGIVDGKSNASVTTATRGYQPAPAAHPLVPGAIPWCRRACGMDLRLTLQSAI